ncbi:MAG: glycosyltransferase family 39 protein [Vulcanimicrobiota bacterium]
MLRKAYSYPSVVLLATLIGVLLLRIGHLWAPTFRDEGIFAYVGQEVLRGYLPFETVFENKGVFLFYQLAGALSLFGFGSVAGVRFLGILWVLVATSCFFYTLKAQYGLRKATWGTALLSFHWSLNGLQGNYYGSEMFSIPLIMVGLYFGWCAGRESKWWQAVAAGVFLSLAVWTRLTSATFVLSLGVFLVLFSRQGKIQNTLLYCLGGIAASLPFLALYAIPGKLSLLHEAYFLFSGIQASATSIHGGIWNQLGPLFRVLAENALILLIGVVVVPFTPWWKERADIYWFLHLVAAIFAFSLTGHYLVKQMQQFYPPLCALLGVRLATTLGSSDWKKSVAALLLIVSIGSSLWRNVPPYYRISKGDFSQCDPMLVASEKVSAWIRENTTPEDEVYNWGVEWELYFRSERRSPVRQINTLAIVLTAIAFHQGFPVEKELAAFQDEVYSSLKSRPPRIIITTASIAPSGIEGYDLPPMVAQFVMDHYDFKFKEYELWVFERKP